MEESAYHKLVAKVFRRIEDALEDVDPDVVDTTSTGDVFTLSFANGVRCVINTQRPVRQLWVAARDTAWHFDYDGASERWVDDRGRGLELFATLAKIVQDQTGQRIAL